MAESTRLVDLVQDALDHFLDDREPQLRAIAPELASFVDYSRDLLRGGKRFRALFCFWGWQSVSGFLSEPGPLSAGGVSTTQTTIVDVACALELFHAAALVHDLSLIHI